MSIPVAVTALIVVLSIASAVVQVRKGRWWTVVSVVLPALGMVAMLGSLEWKITALLWPALILPAAGFAVEGMAHRQSRTPGKCSTEQ